MRLPVPQVERPSARHQRSTRVTFLAFQVSIYQDEGFPRPAGSIPGTYDLWIDDIEFIKDDSGLETRPGFPLANSGSMLSCIKPRGPSADAKFLVSAYNQWKSTFVSGNKVIRPDHQNDTISEGIAYGMLIAVNMNDQDLFDGLYGFWKNHPASTTSLMTSCVPGGSPDGGAATGAPCAASGGSATGADEDAAYALLMADKALGWNLQSRRPDDDHDIWANDIDSAGTKLPKGGSGYGSPASGVTSASYFAPAFYRAFAAVDGAHDWAGVIAAVYDVIGGAIAGSNGLIPGWCGSSCTVAASNGLATDVDYQYDSHRIPMRIGLDYCFNSTDEAKAYATKTTAFFATSPRRELASSWTCTRQVEALRMAAAATRPRCLARPQWARWPVATRPSSMTPTKPCSTSSPAEPWLLRSTRASIPGPPHCPRTSTTTQPSAC